MGWQSADSRIPNRFEEFAQTETQLSGKPKEFTVIPLGYRNAKLHLPVHYYLTLRKI